MGNRRLNGKTRHGLRWHSAYPTWNGMMDRCYNPKNTGWKNYGGRGIKVCKRWHSVKYFVSDMGEKPVGYSIDRIDNNSNYSPSNCRWATRLEQCNNLRKNVRLSYQGRSLTLAEWSREIGMNRNTLKKRWRLGWSATRIIEAPIDPKMREMAKKRFAPSN